MVAAVLVFEQFLQFVFISSSVLMEGKGGWVQRKNSEVNFFYFGGVGEGGPTEK